MKARFMIVMLAGAAWLGGAADRPASDSAVEQTGNARVGPARSRRGGPVRPSLPKRPARRSPRIPSEGATNPIQGSGAPAPAARGSLIPNPAAGRAAPGRSQGSIGGAAAPLSNMRHRSPNPAVVAGSAKQNAGAIGGNQVHQRP